MKGTGYEYLKLIELEHGARHLKEHPNIHLIHKWRNARKSLGRVHESEAKGASIRTKTKQSMGMKVVSLVILEISRQLESDS